MLFISYIGAYKRMFISTNAVHTELISLVTRNGWNSQGKVI